MTELVLKAEAICKRFGRVKALDQAEIEVYKGEIHGLIGENGSGKSTLSSIIAGIRKADSGRIILNGNPVEFSNPAQANRHGICMLLQERGVFLGMSVAANIYVGREQAFLKHGFLEINAMNRAAKKALEKAGLQGISPSIPIERLDFEQQKLVEIARAVDMQPEILIVDETTASLGKYGRDILYQVIRERKEAGKSVVIISHDLEEIRSLCDRITILRDGQPAATFAEKEPDIRKLRHLMVGRDIKDNFYRNDSHATRLDDAALKIEGACTREVRDIDLTLYRGEILGIGGLTESGMHEIGRIAFGTASLEKGRVILANGAVIKTPVQAVKNGIGYVQKDRDREALMLAANIKDNICAPSLSKLRKGPIITGRAEKKFAGQWAEHLNIKMSGINQMVSQLSGGNKQKVSVAKWLGNDADILVFDCPTRGIDIGVKAAIYDLLTELKKQGKAILMISEELAEVIGMSDRIIIMKDGRINGTFYRDEEPSEVQLIEFMI